MRSLGVVSAGHLGRSLEAALALEALRMAVPGVERLALDAGHRSTRDRPCLASCWLPPFLDLEGPAWPTGTTRRFSRDSQSDPQDVP